MSRPPFFASVVATAEWCRDLKSSQLISRPLNVVATSSLLLMISRLLNDVATLISLQADVVTTSNAVLMSRPLVFFFINSWLPDFEFLSRPARFAFNYSSVANVVLSSRP